MPTMTTVATTTRSATRAEAVRLHGPIDAVHSGRWHEPHRPGSALWMDAPRRDGAWVAFDADAVREFAGDRLPACTVLGRVDQTRRGRWRVSPFTQATRGVRRPVIDTDVLPPVHGMQTASRMVLRYAVLQDDPRELESILGVVLAPRLVFERGLATGRLTPPAIYDLLTLRWP